MSEICLLISEVSPLGRKIPAKFVFPFSSTSPFLI